jgi:hypothetical protein
LEEKDWDNHREGGVTAVPTGDTLGNLSISYLQFLRTPNRGWSWISETLSFEKCVNSSLVSQIKHPCYHPDVAKLRALFLLALGDNSRTVAVIIP